MKIMVIGSGAREHVLADKLNQDPGVTEVIVSPGNAGIAKKFRCLKPADETNVSYLSIANDESIDLVVVGPEAPLVNGIVDLFQSVNLPIFGPNMAAAKVTEGSKISCKELLVKAGVPTAGYFVPKTLYEAFKYINGYTNNKTASLVIKADGLCAGKGVIVCAKKLEAILAASDALEKGIYGQAGERIIIEERLFGTECSFMVLTNGKYAIPLLQAKDYKHEFADDEGSMTGGMGAYAPTNLDDELVGTIMNGIVYPTLLGLQNNNVEYRGLLYFGLMLTDDGPKVLEINCRFGDPETEVILPLLASSLLELIQWTIEPGQKEFAGTIKWQDGCAVGVVLASPGYPQKPQTGNIISGLAEAGSISEVELFYAGVKADCVNLLTSGGRVVTVVGLGDNMADARAEAYAAVDKIDFVGGKKFRSDIALKVK
ncbi:MAG: phosphoribosylamine--glycine ligase [Patescibacteria group bacterium]